MKKINIKKAPKLALDWLLHKASQVDVRIVTVKDRKELWSAEDISEFLSSEQPRCFEDGKPVSLFGCPLRSFFDDAELNSTLVDWEMIGTRPNYDVEGPAVWCADIYDSNSGESLLSVEAECRKEAVARLYALVKFGNKAAVPVALL